MRCNGITHTRVCSLFGVKPHATARVSYRFLNQAQNDIYDNPITHFVNNDDFATALHQANPDANPPASNPTPPDPMLSSLSRFAPQGETPPSPPPHTPVPSPHLKGMQFSPIPRLSRARRDRPDRLHFRGLSTPPLMSRSRSVTELFNIPSLMRSHGICMTFSATSLTFSPIRPM